MPDASFVQPEVVEAVDAIIKSRGHELADDIRRSAEEVHAEALRGHGSSTVLATRLMRARANWVATFVEGAVAEIVVRVREAGRFDAATVDWFRIRIEALLGDADKGLKGLAARHSGSELPAAQLALAQQAYRAVARIRSTRRAVSSWDPWVFRPGK